MEYISSLHGDEGQAFKLIYLKYWRLILLYLHQKTRSNEVAEDIASKCFTQLWEERHTIEDERHLKNWLYKTATHRLIDHIRRRKVMNDAYDALVYLSTASEEGLEKRGEVDWIYCQIVDALGKLSDKYREALLSDISGVSVHKDNKYYLVLHRAKNALRKAVEEAIKNRQYAISAYRGGIRQATNN